MKRGEEKTREERRRIKVKKRDKRGNPSRERGGGERRRKGGRRTQKECSGVEGRGRRDEEKMREEDRR